MSWNWWDPNASPDSNSGGGTDVGGGSDWSAPAFTPVQPQPQQQDNWNWWDSGAQPQQTGPQTDWWQTPVGGGSDWTPGAPAQQNSNPIVNWWNGITQPWQDQQPQPQQQSNEWWSGLSNFFTQDVGSFAQKAGESAMNAMQPLSMIGDFARDAANSNIPVLSQGAQLARSAWMQGVEPLGNAAMAQYGALSDNGDLMDLAHAAGPFGWLAGGLADVAQGRNPLDYWQGVINRSPLPNLVRDVTDTNYGDQQYNSALSQIEAQKQSLIQGGMTPAQAEAWAADERTKLQNPINLAERQGMEGFSKLPSWAQLGIQFTDPLANKVYGAATEPFIHAATAPVKWAGEATGITPAIKEAIASPQQKANATQRLVDHLQGTIQDPGALGQMEEAFNMTGAQSIREFLDPNSPAYYKRFNIPDEYAGVLNDVLQASGDIAKVSPERQGFDTWAAEQENTAAQGQNPARNSYLAEERFKQEPNEYQPITTVANELNQDMLDAYGKPLYAENSTVQERIDRAVNEFSQNLEYQLKKEVSGKDWYTKDLGVMEANVKKVWPELQQPEKMGVFKAITAVTSNGQTPSANMSLAAKIYQIYRNTGQIAERQPNGRGWSYRRGMADSLRFIGNLIAQRGEAGATEWLNAYHPVAELKALRPGISREWGKGLTEAPGWLALAPKLGSFGANLSGDLSRVTMDMWWTRSWNRAMGTLYEMDGSPAPGAPRDGYERMAMYRTAEILGEKYNLKPAEVQAALWYFEQQLWKNEGAKVESDSYSAPSVRLAEKEGHTPIRSYEELAGTGTGTRVSYQGESPLGRSDGGNRPEANRPGQDARSGPDERGYEGGNFPGDAGTPRVVPGERGFNATYDRDAPDTYRVRGQDYQAVPEPSNTPSRISDAASLKSRLDEAFPNFSDEQRAGLAALVDARAETWAKETGRPKNDWYDRLVDVKNVDTPSEQFSFGKSTGSVLPDGVRGLAMGYANAVEHVITAFKAADVETVAHELGHVFYQDLSKADQLAVARMADDHIRQNPNSPIANSKYYNAEQRATEYFAYGFTRWLAEGKAPTRRLAALFQRFKDWIVSLTGSLSQTGYGVRPAAGMRELYAKLFDSERPSSNYRGVSDEIYARHNYDQMKRTGERLTRDGRTRPSVDPLMNSQPIADNLAQPRKPTGSVQPPNRDGTRPLAKDAPEPRQVPIPTEHTPEYLKPLMKEIPDFFQGTSRDYLDTAMKAYRLKVGADVVDKKTGMVRTAKNLEQWGAAGAVLRAVGYPIGYMSRAYLSTISRFFRDGAGNILKASIEGEAFWGNKMMDQRFRDLGLAQPDLMSAMGRDVEMLNPKQGGLGDMLLTISQPHIELQNKLLRWVSKNVLKRDDLKDWNVATEKSEGWIKGNIYRREAVRQFEKMVDDAIANKRVSPALAEALKDPRMVDMLKGKLPGGSFKDAFTNTYHPLNFSPEVVKLRDRVEQSQFRSVAAMWDSIPDRLQEYNNLMAKWSKASKVYKPVELADLTPDHPFFKGITDNEGKPVTYGRGEKPLWKGFDNEVQDLKRSIYNSRIADEKQAVAQGEYDPRLNDLTKYNDAIRDPALVRGSLELDQMRMAAEYDTMFGADTDIEARLFGPKVKMNEALYQKLNEVFDDANWRKLSPAERARNIDDFHRLDAQLREFTGDRFKLDPYTLKPIENIAGERGQFLDAMEAQGAIARPGRPDYSEKPLPKTFDEALNIAEQLLPDHVKKEGLGWDAMTPEEQRYYQSRLSVAILGVDPHDPHLSALGTRYQVAAVNDWLKSAKDDMRQRFTSERQRAGQAYQDFQAKQAQSEAVLKEMIALRQEIAGKASEAAFKHVSEKFFDYGAKNTVDQALGYILPFQFWARQNVAWFFRHMSNNPYHFAALMQFYSNLQKENAAQGVPDYARGNILLWQNPDGSRVLLNFASFFPINPLGDNSQMMKVVNPGESDYSNVANKNPLAEVGAFLMGKDLKTKKGEFYDRDLGLLPSFIRPNPIFDIPMKMELWSDFLKGQGWTDDNFGNAGKKEDQTLGLLPGRSLYRVFGEASGASQFLRDKGVPMSDLDIEAPFNEILFGKNAGKPSSAIVEELAGMAQRGELSEDQAMQAVLDFKQGKITPEWVKALHNIDAEKAGLQAANYLGFLTLVTNTPRQELSNKLGADYGKVAESVKDLDPKDAKKVVAAWFDKNPGAAVDFAKSKSAQEVQSGLDTSRAMDAYTKLVAENKAKTISSAEYEKQLRVLADKYPDNDTLKKAVAQAPYYTWLEGLDKIKGNYDDLNKQINDAFARGDKKGAYAIMDSSEYQQIKSSILQYRKTSPEMAKQYDEYMKSKYPDYVSPEDKLAQKGGSSSTYSSGGSRAYSTKSSTTSTKKSVYVPRTGTTTGKTSTYSTSGKSYSTTKTTSGSTSSASSRYPVGSKYYVPPRPSSSTSSQPKSSGSGTANTAQMKAAMTALLRSPIAYSQLLRYYGKQEGDTLSYDEIVRGVQNLSKNGGYSKTTAPQSNTNFAYPKRQQISNLRSPRAPRSSTPNLSGPSGFSAARGVRKLPGNIRQP